MTATERLRQLLDERGVEWIDFDGEPTWMGNDRMHYARQECSCDEPTDEVTVYHLTPEQAVEATLGSDEVADLRQALADLWPRASFTMCPENRESWLERLAELGIEVDE